MAAVRGPALSLSARGAIAKTIVYSAWKGIPVARHYVVPANPKTAGQNTQRGFMTAAVASWHAFAAIANAADMDAWRLRASQLGPMSGFNAYARYYIDERVLGVTVTGFISTMVVSDPTHNSVDLTIHDSAAGADSAILYAGATPGFQTAIQTANEVAGVTTLAAHNTGLAAGDPWYFWLLNNAGKQRSGLYRIILT
jgi:hypothetical protein